MRMTRDRVSALFFLALSIGYGVMAQDIPELMVFGGADQVMTPKTLPTALAFLGGGIALLMLVLPAPPSRTGDYVDLGFRSWRALDWLRFAGLLVAMVIYAWMLGVFGFIVATSLFLMAGYVLLGERRPAVLLGASIPVVVVFWALLTQVLGIFLTPGSFWQTL